MIAVTGATGHFGRLAIENLSDRGIAAAEVVALARNSEKAGSRRVLELHGSLAWVRCLGCKARVPRTEYQRRLDAVNADWAERPARWCASGGVEAAPDGDAELPA